MIGTELREIELDGVVITGDGFTATGFVGADRPLSEVNIDAAAFRKTARDRTFALMYKSDLIGQARLKVVSARRLELRADVHGPKGRDFLKTLSGAEKRLSATVDADVMCTHSRPGPTDKQVEHRTEVRANEIALRFGL